MVAQNLCRAGCLDLRSWLAIALSLVNDAVYKLAPDQNLDSARHVCSCMRGVTW